MLHNIVSLPQPNLDELYSPSYWSKRLPRGEIVSEHLRILFEFSALVKREISTQLYLDVNYSDGDATKYDIFYPKMVNITNLSPVLVYIHGGYWTLMGKEYSAFPAKVFTDSSIIYVALGYDLSPKVPMKVIVDSVRTSMISLFSRFSSRRIYICGHSAGAHLAAILFHTDWKLYGFSISPIQGFILISGIYDLDPIISTYVNDTIQLTQYSAKEFSPIFQNIPSSSSESRILIVVGEDDSPSFIFQAKMYHNYVKQTSNFSNFVVIPRVDHFNIIENLRFECYCLSKAIVYFINSTCISKYRELSLFPFVSNLLI